MYSLVNDLCSYPDFLPWCRGADVLEKTEDGLVARLDLAPEPLHFSLITRNRNLPDRAIHMELVEGPFSDFAGCWEFQEQSSAHRCSISLSMMFEFRSTWTRHTLGVAFNAFAQVLVERFVQRAEVLYGSADEAEQGNGR